MSQYNVKELVYRQGPVDCAASATTPVTDPFIINGEDSRNILVRVNFTEVAETTGISVALQDTPNTGISYSTVKSTTVTSVANVDTVTFATKAGTAHGDYVVLYDASDVAWAVAASTAGIKEVTTITCVADVASSLDGTTFILSDNAGTVGFWIDVGNTGTTIPAEASACDRAVEITTVTADMTADQVAGVVATAVNADAEFVAPAAVGAVVTVTDNATGARADASASTSGFTMAVTTQGSALGAEPSGAVWTAIAADHKGQADISGDTTAAQVAARFELAFDALSGISAALVTDDTAADGTMTFTAVTAGVNTTAGVTMTTNDSGDGSASIAATTAGSFTAAYELENNVLNGSDTAMWPVARVVVITQASDTATVDSVLVTKR